MAIRILEFSMRRKCNVMISQTARFVRRLVSVLIVASIVGCASQPAQKPQGPTNTTGKSHSHADQNNFCIMKGGKALAIPSGHYTPVAGMPHHVEWTCSTKANNCVLVNREGQAIRQRAANGRITAFHEQKGLSYVAGDAAAAYMGKIRRFDRYILFLLPCLFLLLDDLEAPQPALFQWMLHTLEKMELDTPFGRVISRRKGATLDVRLRSSIGLVLSQTDQFGTPYNAGVPLEFRKEMPDQWHLTAETTRKADSVRIGAVMVVSGPHERFDLDVIEEGGWFGARVRGAFGRMEGWLQLRPETARNGPVARGPGRDRSPALPGRGQPRRGPGAPAGHG